MTIECRGIACFRCGALVGKSSAECPKSKCKRPSDIRDIFFLDVKRKIRILHENKKLGSKESRIKRLEELIEKNDK